jgi:hypothetical protein
VVLHRRPLAAAAVAVVALLAAPGCGPRFEEALVVGHDAAGTPVVGAVDCSYDSRYPVELVSVSTLDGTRPGQVVWQLERPGIGRRTPEGGPPPPPAPDPRLIGGVEMVAIGDPRPPGGEVAVALAEPLPDEVLVEAHVYVDEPRPFAEARLTRSGTPGTYTVAYGGDTESGLDAAEVAASIEEHCEDEAAPDLTPVVVGLLVTVGALVLLAVPLGLVTARQFRRAGAARPPGS